VSFIGVHPQKNRTSTVITSQPSSGTAIAVHLLRRVSPATPNTIVRKIPAKPSATQLRRKTFTTLHGGANLVSSGTAFGQTRLGVRVQGDLHRGRSSTVGTILAV
jgi:hypothetical protein